MEERKIVAIVIENQGKILLMKRAPWMKNAPGLWSVCAGTIEERESTEQAAAREAKEETGLIIKIEKEADPIRAKNNGEEQLVFPVLAATEKKDVKLTGEHIAFKWIKPNEIWDYMTVPLLLKELELLGIDTGKPAQKKLF